MNEHHKKNNRTIIIILLVSIIPFVYAGYLAKNTDWIEKGTNNGELIIPPITTEINEFIGFDPFSRQNMVEIKGHWVLINVITSKECREFCLQAIHKTKQLRLMMNKELTRIRRLVVIIPEVDNKMAKQWWKEDTRLLRATASPSLLQKLKSIRKADIPEGMLFLMDPFGNLMMQYGADFDPYKVKKDLKKLLRISQIG
ncbi:MAG: hypothetical protein HFP77_06185 [Methylococcales symbiont of Iophon sp. n. MRB-2018]|nr:MAG: hypothetical protein HFP77_06185 [Methylococcales symbiont of Iophon sp. n. MRB-2018]KAF3978956.1 MAG: hypothetical protein HFP76_09510 [Methylococcales symbiont of Iophon sp. n. MRB-2018]